MTESALNNTINTFVKEHLSPKPLQRSFITEKYKELSGFLAGNCFQAGSYARFTAIHPAHDLDVIYVTSDVSVTDDPSGVIRELLQLLESSYGKSKITRLKKIYAQTHSVTVEFEDGPEEFSIDIVPAIELLSNDSNEYGDSLYRVPEILTLNRHNREHRYAMAMEHPMESPIKWIRSDPRGYVQAASDLDSLNENFRHTAKLLKGWRHACKEVHGDMFKLKSFHLEQIVFSYFFENPKATTVEAAVNFLEVLPNCITTPHIVDRANPDRCIDEYVEKLTAIERQLILREQSEAYNIIRLLASSDSEQQVFDQLCKIIGEKKRALPITALPTLMITPRQPWAAKLCEDVE